MIPLIITSEPVMLMTVPSGVPFILVTPLFSSAVMVIDLSITMKFSRQHHIGQGVDYHISLL